jgi:tetratricopeptide (TPR) repeat protein/peroxiredoxin
MATGRTLTRPFANVSFASTRESGDIGLSRPGKSRDAIDPRLANLDISKVDQTRRDFLVRCGLGAATSLFIPNLSSFTFPDFAQSLEFDSRLHPGYRSQTPLDALLLKIQPGHDDFVTEKYAAQISAILAEWSASLLQSMQELHAIEKVLAPDFVAASPRPIDVRSSRSGPHVEAAHRVFAPRPSLTGRQFLLELREYLASFSKILIAEFQVTSIDLLPSQRLRTNVRYELVGSGKNFYREQRVGEWELKWEHSDRYLLKTWRLLGESQSRAVNPVFADVSAQTLGATSSYSSQLQHGADYWRTVLDGASGIDIYGHNGVSVGDIDGDGFDDLYICQAAGLPNRLYRNRGDGTFEDITESSGVGVLENTACALFIDIDNDGRQDLIVVRTNGPLLFLNESSGRFRQKPNAFKFNTPPQGTFTGAAATDYDRDGWLDIYFCLYLYYQGTDQYRYPAPYYDAQNGPPNFLMRNNRDGTFSDVTVQSGLTKNNTRYSFCCAWNDYNGDGWPDLYVVNDFGRKNLYRNNRDGTFTDVADQARVDDVGAGMSVSWCDYDNDGAEDLYVANMWTAAGLRVSQQELFQKKAPDNVRAHYRKHAMGNSLFRNKRDGGFEDGSAAGVSMGRWSWSSDAWDFDHDGFSDLYIANGMVSGGSREDLNSFFWRQVVANSPVEAKPRSKYEEGWNALNEILRSDGTWSGFERNVFYANNHDGTFSNVSGALGLDFIEDARAFALSDFDHDGRLELFLKNRNAPQLRVLKNVLIDLFPAIAFHLRGTKSNRDAIGTVVTIETEIALQTRTLQAGSGFLSQHSKDIFFGLGEAKHPVRAKIRWPSGLVQELRELPPNHRIWVEEGIATPRLEPFSATRQRLKPSAAIQSDTATAVVRSRGPEQLPATVETWLLAPLTAPDFALQSLNGQTHTFSALKGSSLLLNFWTSQSADCEADLRNFSRVHKSWSALGLQLITINADDSAKQQEAIRGARNLQFQILLGSDDVLAIYNILYRYVFDRHRDLSLPTSFLIDEAGEIVKIYQGPINPAHVEEDFRHIPRSHTELAGKALPFGGVTDAAEFRRNYLSLGSVFFQRAYFDQAAASFQRAFRDDPSSAEALYGLGSVYLKQDKFVEARESFEQATKLSANYPETLPNAWNNLGLLATREGRTSEAIPYFQEALRLSPDHLVALENLGNAYRQQKQWDEARKVLEHAVAVGPDDPEGNYSLAMVFAQLDDTEHAYEYLERALELRPEYPEALNNLGILYLRTNRRDEAVSSFETSIRVAPEFDQSYLNLARVYALAGAIEKSRETLRALLKQHPGHEQAQKMLAELAR